MIYRSSSLLSKNDNASYSIAEMARTPETYLECLLQLNEECQEAENEYNIAYYRALKESALNESTDVILSEGLISKAAEVLSKMIEAIINFFRKIIAKIRGGESKKKAAAAKSAYDKLEKDNTFKAERKSFICYSYADWKTISDINVLRYTKELEQHIRDLCAGMSNIAEPTEDSLAGTFGFLAALCKKAAGKRYVERHNVKVINDETFRQFITNNIVYRESKEMTGAEWLSLHDWVKSGESAYEKSIGDGFEKRLKELESLFKNNATALTTENFQKAKGYINQYKILVQSWGWFLGANHLVFEAALKDFNSYNESMQTESSTIHGELFNSDTLFANEDPRDFNRTEWMDLELTAEAYCFNQAINEARRSMAVQEAIIWSENAIPSDTFRKLQAMQEAEINKLANAIQDIIKRVKEFVTKFINDLQNKHGPNAAFMKKYAAQIKNPFKIAEVSSTGNILDGLARMQESRHISFNPATMNEEDKAAMFKTHFLTGFASKASGGKRPVKWEDGITISDYCKAYYGASMPVDQYPPVKYNTQELNGAKDNIMKFMDAPHAFFSKIKQELSELEKEAKKAGAEAVRPNIDVNNTAQTSNNAGQQNANQGGGDNNAASGDAKQESMFYSVLYDRWFNEMDIANGPEAGDGDTKGGEGEAKKQNNSKVYIECLKDILLAKLTAARFIYSECNQLIRAHAKSYMSKEQVAAEAKAEKGNAQNNQQNQQQAQGQQN